MGRHLRERRPAQDIYLIASSSEEIGGIGATYALAHLPIDTAIAVDIAPAAAEYGTVNSGDPIIGVRDGSGLYDGRIIDRFEELATASGFGIQTAVLTSYSSDSTLAKAGRYGRPRRSNRLPRRQHARVRNLRVGRHRQHSAVAVGLFGKSSGGLSPNNICVHLRILYLA